MPTSSQAVISKAQARQDVRALFEDDKMKAQLRMALPTHVKLDHFLRVLFTINNKTPKLAECTRESLFACIMDCAQLGLEPDGRNAYLVPFNDRRNNRVLCTLIVGYQGLIELAYRHPKVKGIRWNVVHKKDHFIYKEGLEASLEFTPCDEDDPGELTHAFAIAELEGGGKAWVVLNRRDVMKAKASSRGAEDPSSPWQIHPEAMWAKTAVRALCKRIPRSSELIQALQADFDEQEEPPTITVPSFTNIAPVPNLPPPQPKPAPARPNPTLPEPAPATAPGEEDNLSFENAAPPPMDKANMTPLEMLKIEMATASITEDQVLAWGCDRSRRYWPVSSKSLDEIAEVSPTRIELVLASFSKLAKDVAVPA